MTAPPPDVARSRAGALVERWLPRAIAAAAFALYALAAPPGPYWLDSSELSTAAVRLGSPHPTGFPLYTVLAHVGGYLPIGELAFRMHLVSALCAALAILWLQRFVIAIARGGGGSGGGARAAAVESAALAGAATAGIALALSFTFARQATVAEVYAPTAALLAGALVLFERAARTDAPAAGLALALVCGLGLASHTGFALIGAPVAALCLVRLRRGARWPLIAPLLVVLAASAMYASAPVRAATGRTAAVDWGHPRTLAAWADHVSARRIRDAYADEMQSTNAAVVSIHAERFAADVGGDLGPLALVAAAGGLLTLVRRRRTRWAGVAVLAIGLGDAVYSIWMNPMGQRDLQNGVPFALAAAAAAGAGVAWLARQTGRVAAYTGGALAIFVAVPALAVSWPALWPAARADAARGFVEAALDATPSRGVLLVQSDSLAANLMFVTAVEGARPDVAALARQHLGVDRERTAAVLAASGGLGFGLGSGAGDLAAVSAGLAAEARPLAAILAGGRPVRWELGADAVPPGWRVVLGAPVVSLQLSGSPDESADDADLGRASADLAALFAGAGADDRSARAAHGNSLVHLGLAAFARGRLDAADALFAAAAEVRPGYAQALINRGEVAARRGDFAGAAALAERAVAADGLKVGALVNAARYRIQLGSWAEAAAELERALVLDDQRADAWALLALVDLQTDRRERALDRLARALALDPRDADAVSLARQLEAHRP